MQRNVHRLSCKCPYLFSHVNQVPGEERMEITYLLVWNSERSSVSPKSKSTKFSWLGNRNAYVLNFQVGSIAFELTPSLAGRPLGMKMEECGTGSKSFLLKGEEEPRAGSLTWLPAPPVKVGTRGASESQKAITHPSQVSVASSFQSDVTLWEQEEQEGYHAPMCYCFSLLLSEPLHGKKRNTSLR